MKRRCLVLGTALLAAGCGGQASEPLVACEDPVFITVTTGAAPQFTWQPPCLISRVVVQDSVGTILWDVQTAASSIPPGVRYAQTPQGAQELTPPVTLIAGRSYAVGLYRATGLLPADVELLSAVAFRP